MTRQIRVVLLGTPDFAVPTLRALAEAPNIDVIRVITQPDRPVGRKRELVPSPVKRAAQSYGFPVDQPEKVSSKEYLSVLDELKPDVMVTAAYGQILSTKFLEVAAHGCLNVHASLLPRWRGAAPIHRAIMAGDELTGVTIMKTVRELDAGPILGMESVPITNDDTTSSLHDTLAEVGARLLLELLPPYVSKELLPRPQPETGITYAHRIVRSDEWIRFDQPVIDVHNHLRALTSWPGGTALHQGNPVKLFLTRLPGHEIVNSQLLPEADEGTVFLTNRGTVFVRCLDGWLELLEVQPAGKKRMAAADWLRGLRTNQLHLEPMEATE